MDTTIGSRPYLDSAIAKLSECAAAMHSEVETAVAGHSISEDWPDDQEDEGE